MESGENMDITEKYETVKLVARTQSTTIMLSKRKQAESDLVIVKAINRRRRSLCQLEREKEIRSSLPPHPNIIGLLEICDSPETCYMVEEYMGNGDLADAIMAGSVDEAMARRVFTQLVSALNGLHDHDVVHGDVKCDNILLDAQRNARLTDFEHSIRLSEQQTTHYSNGRCTGSMPYNAPEMFVTHSNEHDLRALDMWAAGIVLYATVLSAFPWERAAASDQHYRAYKAGDTGALDGWDRLGEKEIELLQGLLCIDATTRWTARQAAAWIDRNWSAAGASVAATETCGLPAASSTCPASPSAAPPATILHRIPMLLARSPAAGEPSLRGAVPGATMRSLSDGGGAVHPAWLAACNADSQAVSQLVHDPHTLSAGGSEWLKARMQLPWVQLSKKVSAT